MIDHIVEILVEKAQKIIPLDWVKNIALFEMNYWNK